MICVYWLQIMKSFFFWTKDLDFNHSSNVNEVITAILNFFICFYKNISHAQKAQNAYKRTKTKKAAFFMRLESI